MTTALRVSIPDTPPLVTIRTKIPEDLRAQLDQYVDVLNENRTRAATRDEVVAYMISDYISRDVAFKKAVAAAEAAKDDDGESDPGVPSGTASGTESESGPTMARAA